MAPLTWLVVLVLPFHQRAATAFTGPRTRCAGNGGVVVGIGAGHSQSRTASPSVVVNSAPNDGDRDRRLVQTTDPRSVASDLQVIASKFLLEVMGAAGAVWGCADILALRNTPEGAAIARQAALWVGGVFFLRYLYLQRRRGRGDASPGDVDPGPTPLPELASRLVLQVLGGAGAVWGSAEVLTLRNFDNAGGWRVAALAAGCTFLARWTLQVVARLGAFRSDTPSKPTTAVRWFEAGVAPFILEVLGAAGAVWGFSEIVLLRNLETNVLWRPIALSIGVVFLIRWIVHLLDSGTVPNNTKDAGGTKSE